MPANLDSAETRERQIRSELTHTLTSISVEVRDRFFREVEEALKPFIADKGWDWEWNVEETRRDMWSTNGLVPPMPDSKSETEWIEANRPLPYKLEDAGLKDGQPVGFSAQI